MSDSDTQLDDLLHTFARMAVMHAAGVVDVSRKDAAGLAVVDHVERAIAAAEQPVPAMAAVRASLSGPILLPKLPSQAPGGGRSMWEGQTEPARPCPGCGVDLNMVGGHNCPGRLDR